MLIVAVVVLLVLLLMSALISGSEAAFFSLSPADKEEVKGDDSKKASFVNKMLNRPKELLATILIAPVIASCIKSAISAKGVVAVR